MPFKKEPVSKMPNLKTGFNTVRSLQAPVTVLTRQNHTFAEQRPRFNPSKAVTCPVYRQRDNPFVMSPFCQTYSSGFRFLYLS